MSAKMSGRALLGGPARFIPLLDGERVGSLLEQIDQAEHQVHVRKEASKLPVPAGLKDEEIQERRRELLLHVHQAQARLENLKRELESEQAGILRLRYDWGALAEYEAEFETAEDEDQPFDVATLKPSQKRGTLNAMARWAYAMTSTDREDRGIAITFAEFRRRIPIESSVALAWQTNVTALFVEQKNSGGEEGATSNVDGSASPESESSGISSTGSEPTNSDEPTEPSAE